MEDAANPYSGADRAAFERLMVALRPKLHRYCARMSGSVIDGEDLVQDTLVKAMEAYRESERIANPEGWLFRIAHNTTLDFLRRKSRGDARHAEVDMTEILDPLASSEQRQIAAASLRTFMRLPAAQRSSVILMDVLGYSLEEIGGITQATIPAVKAALSRGRTRLKAIAGEEEDAPRPPLAPKERELLAAYVDRFNARDFDAVRGMLAEEVRLELVDRERKSGRREVGGYLDHYASVTRWRFAAAQVEERPAVLVSPADRPDQPAYFVLLEWSAGGVRLIRDFHYARYAMEGAEIRVLA